MNKRNFCIVVNGATGTAIEIAKRFDGEVVNADSLQLYRGLDIATAKISVDEMEVPHHILSICDSNSVLNIREYTYLAIKVIDDIFARGHCAVIVGGTNYYIENLLFPNNLENAQTNSDDIKPVSATFTDTHKKKDVETSELYSQLCAIHPEIATLIHPSDHRKIKNALGISSDKVEVYRARGSSIPESCRFETTGNSSRHPMCAVVVVHIACDMSELAPRLAKRVDKMLSNGLLQEVRSLFLSPPCYGDSSAASLATPLSPCVSHTGGKIEVPQSVNGDVHNVGVRAAIGYKELVPYLTAELAFKSRMARTEPLFEFPEDVQLLRMLNEEGRSCNYFTGSGSESSTRERNNDTKNMYMKELKELILLLSEAIEQVKLRSARYAKKQVTWLRNRFFPTCERLGIAIVTIDLTDCTSPLPRGAIGSQTTTCAHSSTTGGVSEQTSLNSVRDVRAVVNNSNNNNNSNCANSSTGNSRGSVDRQIAIQKISCHIDTIGREIAALYQKDIEHGDECATASLFNAGKDVRAKESGRHIRTALSGARCSGDKVRDIESREEVGGDAVSQGAEGDGDEGKAPRTGALPWPLPLPYGVGDNAVEGRQEDSNSKDSKDSKETLCDRMYQKRKIFHCDVCDRYFQGNDQFNIHVSSRKHKSVVQASRRKTKNMNNVSNIVRSALVGVKCVVESSLSVDTCANDNALHEECDVKRGKEKEE